MKTGWYAGIVAAGAIVGVVTDAVADTLDALQGQWTMEGTDCADTFKKVGAEVKFSDRAATQTTGIIVSGNKIIGPNANCTAGRVRQEKDHFSVQLSCSDTIMFSSMSVAFKLIDKDSFERFDPTFPDISFLYHKCSL
jgi:hypothetical protein